MANLFPRSANFLPFKIAICLGVAVTGVVLAVSFYGTKKTQAKGYQPDQPIPYDHSLHAGVMEMDCRACHSFVDKSGHANIPSVNVCATCHAAGAEQNAGIKPDSDKLKPLRDAIEHDKPVRWRKIWDAPDYVYFDHSAHVNRGVSCVECHGNIHEQRKVHKSVVHTMGMCLECHNSPEDYIRPVEYVYDLDWNAKEHLLTEENEELLGKLKDWHIERQKEGKKFVELKERSSEAEFQRAYGLFLKEAHSVNPKISCQTCHN